MDNLEWAGVHIKPGGEELSILRNPVPSREAQLRVDPQLSQYGPYQV
jgi:hypothetical protein